MSLESRIATYLTLHLPGSPSVLVDELARIHGGSSQETFRFRALWNEGDEPHERRYILRRAPVSGLVNAAHDLEYVVYSALDGRGIPVPRAHFLELDPQWLDRPFFIMDFVAGKPGHFFGANDPYDGKGAEVARKFWRHLGALASLDHAALGLGQLRNGAANRSFWAAELEHWEAVLDAGEEVIEPIVRGAIRQLRRHPPPEPAKPAVCHGDYRCGNFLFLPDGTISAVLDWEMCHVGDPLEDVAWAINPMWTIERHLPLEEGLAIWQMVSGLKADPRALEWWRLFAAVKACAIWTNAEVSFQERTNREMIVALTAMRASHFHRNEILDRMAKLGAMG